MRFSRRILLFPVIAIFTLIASCKSKSAAIALTESEMIKIAEDTLRSIMAENDFNEYVPLKVVSRNDAYFEVVPHDIEEYAGRPPIVCIDKGNGRIIEIRWGD